MPRPDKGTIELGFGGENGHWSCLMRIREGERTVALFYSYCPVTAPERLRPAVAEFLTYANYGLTLGNFELDLRDGEIRYKTSIDVTGQELTSALLEPLVLANLGTMDRYLPGIMKVCYGNVPPDEAVAEIENKDD